MVEQEEDVGGTEGATDTEYRGGTFIQSDVPIYSGIVKELVVDQTTALAQGVLAFYGREPEEGDKDQIIRTVLQKNFRIDEAINLAKRDVWTMRKDLGIEDKLPGHGVGFLPFGREDSEKDAYKHTSVKEFLKQPDASYFDFVQKLKANPVIYEIDGKKITLVEKLEEVARKHGLTDAVIKISSHVKGEGKDAEVVWDERYQKPFMSLYAELTHSMNVDMNPSIKMIKSSENKVLKLYGDGKVSRVRKNNKGVWVLQGGLSFVEVDGTPYTRVQDGTSKIGLEVRVQFSKQISLEERMKKAEELKERTIAALQYNAGDPLSRNAGSGDPEEYVEIDPKDGEVVFNMRRDKKNDSPFTTVDGINLSDDTEQNMLIGIGDINIQSKIRENILVVANKKLR